MKLGTTLKLQIEGAPCRLTSELIGVEEDKYLIIKMPPMQSMGSASSVMYKGNTVIVRYMHKGSVFGFKSCINHFIIDPVRLIFIEYPKRIENHDLRSHKRVDCYLPASVIIEDITMEGTITDISKEGCQFTIEKLGIKKNLWLLQVDNEIDVNFQLPGVENRLTIKGKQRNIKKDKDNVNIGVKFNNISIEVQEKLYDFLSTAGA